MPVIKSARKQMKQSRRRRARNFPIRSELKTLIKKELGLIKDGKMDEAVKMLPLIFSVIDMACKKNIIHSNNAARKKSRIARALNALQKGGGKVESVAEEVESGKADAGVATDSGGDAAKGSDAGAATSKAA